MKVKHKFEGWVKDGAVLLDKTILEKHGYLSTDPFLVVAIPCPEKGSHLSKDVLPDWGLSTSSGWGLYWKRDFIILEDGLHRLPLKESCYA